MTLIMENRKLVVPGDKVAEGDYLIGEGIFKEGNELYANILGLLDAKENFIKVIPLKGKYVPKVGDLTIGVINDIAFSSWYVDMNSPYSGVLSVANATERFIDLNEEDISKIYDIGDVVLAKVANVSQSMVIGLTMKDRGLFKLKEGRLIEVSPTKVPRVIGRKGTMVQMLKDLTGCRITVGQNGRIWISGENSNLAIEAIKKIEREAHTSGLTDKIRAMLESKKPAKPAAAKPAVTTQLAAKVKKVEQMIADKVKAKEMADKAEKEAN